MHFGYSVNSILAYYLENRTLIFRQNGLKLFKNVKILCHSNKGVPIFAMNAKFMTMTVIFSVTFSSFAGRNSFEMTFNNNASGGRLIFCNPLSRNAQFVSIETQPGESAELVVNKLADAILHSDIFAEWDPEDIAEQKASMVLGNTLAISPGRMSRYCIAGTEIGLGIPEPVTSVSCSFDNLEDQIKVYWENPPSKEYNRIMILFKWIEDSSGEPEQHIRTDFVGGNVTEFSLRRVLFTDLPPVNIDDLDVWIIGFSDNNVASNAAGIHYNYAEKEQEELFGIPFRNGVAPNWKVWGLRDSSRFTPTDKDVQDSKRAVKTEYIRRGHVRMETMITPSAKPIEQILKVPNTGGHVGVWRKFLGLKPGNTYRLTVRVNTLKMDADSNSDWSLSIHMAYNGSAGAEFNEKQLAGLENLPNGDKDLQAGRIAEFNAKNTTQGKYVERAGEITLPKGVDSITVWLRHSSSKATSGVGFDWIKLEDISSAESK